MSERKGRAHYERSFESKLVELRHGVLGVECDGEDAAAVDHAVEA